MLDIILISAVFLVVLVATISDIKTKEIPNWLNFSLILVSFAIFSIKSFSEISFNPILKSINYFLIFLIIGNVMYYTKQWGGGDSKLLMAMGAALPIYPPFLLNFFNPKITNSLPITFLINMVIVGALYGLICTIFLIIKNRKKVSKQFKKLISKHQRFNQFLIYSAIIGSLIFILSQNIILKTISLTLLISPVILSYMFILTKATEQSTMYKKIKTSKLQEGDWINHKIIINKKIIYSPKGLGVTKKQINIIKKYKNEVMIKDGIAFAPTFLISLILSLIYGNIILWLI
jgi:prepilin signal peptidase PulO-like enzyme (type II secretory pathway)